MALEVVTAGESHGPALTAIVVGLPAGLRLEKEAIDADLRRRQQGYGRSPRQKLETDEVEVLSGLRHGLTLGTPLDARRPEPRPRELDVGDEPVAARGRAVGEGREARHAAAAGPRRPRRGAQVRPRRRPERARACLRPPHGGARGGRGGREGAAPRARDRRSRVGRSRSAAQTTDDGMREATDAARKDRDTLGGIVEVVADGRAARARLLRREARPARRAARLRADGDPGRQGRRGRRRLRARATPWVGGARRDLPGPRAAHEPRRRHRGGHVERRADRRPRGDEAAPDAHAAARLGRPRDRRAGQGARRAVGRPGGRGARRGRRGGGRVRARPRGAREARRRRAWATSSPLATRISPGSASGGTRAAERPRAAPRARGIHGRGEDDVGTVVARAARAAVRRPRRRDRAPRRNGRSRSCSPRAARQASEQLEEEVARDVLRDGEPAVVALGGGAVLSERDATRSPRSARSRCSSTSIPKSPGTRVAGSGRPLARDEEAFHALHRDRQPLYEEVADAHARDVDGTLLAAAGVHVEIGAIDELGRARSRRRSCRARRGRPRLRHPRHHGRRSRSALATSSSTRCPRARRRRRRPCSSGSGRRCGSAVTARSSRSAAVPRPTSSDSRRRPTCAVCPGRRCRRRSSARWTPGSEGRPRSTCPGRRTRVGAFHWPARVVCDPSLLTTLPDDERRNGLAEVVKTGLLAGEPLWELREPEQVRACAAFKAAVCIQDPHDRGPRNQLNLGHTFGHALEAAAGYALPHGRAVALGLLAALRLSGLTDEARVVERRARPGARPGRPRRRLGRARARQEGRARCAAARAARRAGRSRGGASKCRRTTSAAALDELIADPGRDGGRQ